MKPAYSVESVRTVENQLIAQQTHPDELMRLAARAVAATAADLTDGVVLILAGPGGNGGDGLYAGAFLLESGLKVYAHVPDSAQERALAAFTQAGGSLCEDLPAGVALVIDAVAGLGSARGLCGSALALYRAARAAGALILAVDMPTGVHANTGVAAPSAVVADVTITFGQPRAGHAHAPECGEVVVADLHLPGAPSFAELLGQHHPVALLSQENTRFQLRSAQAVDGIAACADPTPEFDSDKYSGGVVGIAAGSAEYPGAGILAATAAVRTTPSLVRFIGEPTITFVLPEVIVHPDLSRAGKVQAWVVGPGRGTDQAAKEELEKILAYRLPTVVDADAITLLAHHPDISLHDRVVLTPHWREFKRLYEGDIGKLDATRGRAALVKELAQKLGCHILLKGRVTTLSGDIPHGINAGHSFAATPGSGDVLSGILGALLAMGDMSCGQAMAQAVALHARASALAARTPAGYAPCSASQIAAAIPEANASLIVRFSKQAARH